MFVSFDMQRHSIMSCWTHLVAVAVNDISGMSNCKKFKLQVLKFFLSTDSLLKQAKASVIVSF